MIDEEQLIELTLRVEEGLTSEPRNVAMRVHPTKLQILLYGL